MSTRVYEDIGYFCKFLMATMIGLFIVNISWIRIKRGIFPKYIKLKYYKINHGGYKFGHELATFLDWAIYRLEFYTFFQLPKIIIMHYVHTHTTGSQNYCCCCIIFIAACMHILGNSILISHMSISKTLCCHSLLYFFKLKLNVYSITEDYVYDLSIFYVTSNDKECTVLDIVRKIRRFCYLRSMMVLLRCIFKLINDNICYLQIIWSNIEIYSKTNRYIILSYCQYFFTVTKSLYRTIYLYTHCKQKSLWCDLCYNFQVIQDFANNSHFHLSNAFVFYTVYNFIHLLNILHGSNTMIIYVYLCVCPYTLYSI